MMTKKERVLAAIRHQKVDKVPKGDLAIDGELLERLLSGSKYDKLSPMAKQVAVRELLHADLINVHEYPMELVAYADDGYPIFRSVLGDLFKDTGHSTHMVKPSIEEIEDSAGYPVPDISKASTRMLDYYREHSDLFLFTQVNGPVSSVYWMLGMEDYMCYCMTDPDEIEILTDKIMQFEIARAKLFIDHGSDGILMADDIGFNSGPLLPPAMMERLAYPFYKKFISEVKAYKDIPIFLHTDGNIYDVIPKIIESGFDGLHSLQPSAGMDIEKIKENYGDRLCLMGNLDLDRLMTFGAPEEVEEEVKRLLKLFGNDGGFILATCNILTDSVKTENALAMYETAEKDTAEEAS